MLLITFLAAAAITAADGQLAGIQAEAASDAFAECYEPKLAEDPVIKSPIDVRAPFEALDNRVSNAALATCKGQLNLPPLGTTTNPDHYRNRLAAMRFVAMRNSFYMSRGAINLEIRRIMRPHLSCIEQNLSLIDLPQSRSSQDVSEAIQKARGGCQSSSPTINFSGSEIERRMREQALSRYVNTYARDFLAFRFKAALDGADK